MSGARGSPCRTEDMTEKGFVRPPAVRTQLVARSNPDITYRIKFSGILKRSREALIEYACTESYALAWS
jgi:hypothetical protein